MPALARRRRRVALAAVASLAAIASGVRGPGLRRFSRLAGGSKLAAGFTQRTGDELFIRPRAVGKSEDMDVVAVFSQSLNATGILHSGNDRHQVVLLGRRHEKEIGR